MSTLESIVRQESEREDEEGAARRFVFTERLRKICEKTILNEAQNLLADLEMSRIILRELCVDTNSLAGYIDFLKKDSTLAEVLARPTDHVKFYKELLDLFFSELDTKFTGAGDFKKECRRLLSDGDYSALRMEMGRQDSPLLRKFRQIKIFGPLKGRVDPEFYGLLLHILAPNTKAYFGHIYDQCISEGTLAQVKLSDERIDFEGRCDSLVRQHEKRSLLFASAKAYYTDRIMPIHREKMPEDMRNKSGCDNAKKIREALAKWKECAQSAERRIRSNDSNRRHPFLSWTR